MQAKDEFYMRRSLQIAKNGLFTARPNPSVGAVIVYKNKIIAEAYTSSYGGSHAEVNAVASVKDTSLLKKAIMYVTLEPCAHFGKTPPCADMILKNEIKRVVIGCLDTNSLVAGKGVKRLQDAGVEVVTGVLEKECREHHKKFFCNQEQKRPFVILKWAETQDGFIYPELDSASYKNDSKSIQENRPVWISNSYSKQLVHKMRTQEQAILVGTNTVLADNPKLDVRTWSGLNPLRVILDRNLRIPKEAAVFNNDGTKVIVFCDKNKAVENLKYITHEQIDFSKNIAKQICEVLGNYKVQSLLVEGGAQTLQTFIDENLWDEAHVFIGSSFFEKGIKGPFLNKKIKKQQNITNDVLKIYIND